MFHRRRQLDELVTLLLEIAGGWGVLSPALHEAAALERMQPSADGAEWARRTLAIIDRHKSANRTFCQATTTRRCPCCSRTLR